MIPFGYKDCINSDESIPNSKSEAIMSSKSNYRYIQNNAGKGFGKRVENQKLLNCWTCSYKTVRFEFLYISV